MRNNHSKNSFPTIMIPICRSIRAWNRNFVPAGKKSM